jgi:hypothetical protein
MTDRGFDELERALESGGAAAAFDLLTRNFRAEKRYPLLFEAMIMNKRRQLGLPLIATGSLEDIPSETQSQLHEAYVAAAREVGGLFLSDGDIPAAWPYFRASGDPEPVAAAIEKETAREGIEPIIDIAFNEGVHPYKGFQLIMAQYGLCRAITVLEQYPHRKGREDCVDLLVRSLHVEVLESLRRTIAENEGKAPESRSILELISTRDWLFGEWAYYVDTSHLISTIRLSADLKDREMLKLAVELTEYGKRLSHHFHYRGDPPFENIYADYGIYLRALLGEDVDGAIAHFRGKIEESDPGQAGSGPAEVLVGLLARLGRFREAIELSIERLPEAGPDQLSCPSLIQLCQLAGDFEQLRRLARERGDLLNFTAAMLQGAPQNKHP